MLKKSIFLLIFILLLSIPQMGYSFNGSALWRSALLPGWCQYYKQDVPKAYIIGGAFVGTLIFNYITWSSADGKHKDYMDATSDFNSKWSDYESARSLNHVSVYLMLGGYLYNLVDAAFLGPKNQETTMGQSGLNFNVTKKATALEYRLNF